MGDQTKPVKRELLDRKRNNVDRDPGRKVIDKLTPEKCRTCFTRKGKDPKENCPYEKIVLKKISLCNCCDRCRRDCLLDGNEDLL